MIAYTLKVFVPKDLVGILVHLLSKHCLYPQSLGDRATSGRKERPASAVRENKAAVSAGVPARYANVSVSGTAAICF